VWEVRELTAAETVARDEFELILNWRMEALERAGYAREDAFVIAACHDIDLHKAVDLVGKGCPPGLALRILL
jgi:hypothetical protein